MSTETALGIIAICQLLITIAIIAGTAGVIIALIIFKKVISSKLDQLIGSVEPILEQTRDIAEQAKEATEKLNTTVESILSRADDTAEKLSSRVDSVSAKVAQVVSPKVASYAAAAVKGFELIQQVFAARRAAATATDAPEETEPTEEQQDS